MEHIIYQNGYQEYKQELRTELEKTSEGFVKIGYLLKVARDTDILKDSGYADYLEFAQGEYGLDKSMVSRFIRINDRFSEEGNSERLLDQYKGFGYAKLALMLTIPEVIAEELTPDLTKSEIKEIKEEIDEEKAITDIEHFSQNAEEIMNPPADSIVVQTIRSIGKDFPRIYVSIHQHWAHNIVESMKKLFMPVEPSTYTTRVPGKGKVILIAKDSGITITEVRSEEKTAVTWDEIMAAWEEVLEYGEMGETGEDSWSKVYGESYPESNVSDTKEPEAKENGAKEPTEKAAGVKDLSKVAPVQPRPKKVNTAKTETPKKKETEKTQKNDEKMPENQNAVLNESESAESDFSEPQNAPSGEAETPINTGKLGENASFTRSRGLDANTLRGYKAGLTADARVVERLVSENNYRAARTKLEGMLNTINRIIDAEEVQE